MKSSVNTTTNVGGENSNPNETNIKLHDDDHNDDDENSNDDDDVENERSVDSNKRPCP